jgi:arylsulfatase
MRRRALLAALAALLAAGCGSPPERQRWNVLVVMADTLRADRLGAYGYARPTSPNFDALAEDGYLFTGARAQAPCTFPSVNSLLTSRYPAAFLGQPDRAMGIPDGIPALPEMLAEHGWATAAISASPIVRATPGKHNPGGGFGRGFATFDERCEWLAGECVTAVALAALDALPEPFFLYLHYLDPHGPYTPPSPYRERFRRGETALEWVERGNPNPIADMLYKAGPAVAYTPADVEYLEGLYEGEIAYFDHQLGLLVEALRKRGLLDRTIVALVADHGESFLEHGHMKHCRSLYDSELKTPLLLRVPGQRASARLDGPASNLDLAPTLLELLGLPHADRGFEGVSLASRLAEGTPADGLSFALGGSLRSVEDGRFKLIHDLRRGSWELYDVAADPRERHDVIREERAAFARLRRELLDWVARSEGESGLRRAEEAEERLRALGYL